MSEILIYGEVGFEVMASDVIREIQGASGGDLTIRVNSPGGDVYEGISIMNALRSHQGAVTAVVEGLAASAASFIAVGGADRVVMRPTAELMIHEAMSFVGGNADEMSRAVSDLDRISSNLAGIYAEKSGGDVGEWRERMRAETWFSADEAVAAGLADAVEDGRPVVAAGSRRVMNHFRFQGRREAPAPVMVRTTDNRKETSMAVLNELAASMGISEDDLSGAIKKIVNEEVTVTSTVEISYPEGSTVVPTGKTTVEPLGEIPSTGLLFSVSDAPEGWTAEVDEATGVLSVTAPSGAEPDTEVELIVSVTGNDVSVDLPVTIKVTSAAGDDDAEVEPSGDSMAPSDDRVVLDVDTYRDLQAAAKLGWEAKAEADKSARAALADRWIGEGRVNVAHRAKVISALEKNERAATDLYGNIPKNTIPVREIGHGRDAETTNAQAKADFKVRANAALGRRSSLF